MEEQAAKTLSDLLLVPSHLYLMAASWILMYGARKILPDLHEHPTLARALPLMPILLCSIGVWIPGAVEPGLLAGERIIMGIVLGGATAYSHKTIKQTILGHDARINGNGK